MFSTFTGSSRRPRNVNLSGQTTNPFSNTSWNPAIASNATKTVTDAQAEREKRQLDRQRLRAASRIQKAWRGHQSRVSLKELRRCEFDAIFQPAGVFDDGDDDDADVVSRRLTVACNLMLFFFSPRRNDDLGRLLLFTIDCGRIGLSQIDFFNGRLSQLQRFTSILVQALQVLSPQKYPENVRTLLIFIDHLTSHAPKVIEKIINEYLEVLARLCRDGDRNEWTSILSSSLSTLLLTAENGTIIYDGLAFHFLACRELRLFEDEILDLGQVVDMEKLATAIVRGYSPSSTNTKSNDELLWLLAHFIDLGRTRLNSRSQIAYLDALLTQTSALSSEISVRINIQPTPDQTYDATDDSLVQPLAPYVSRQLLSLVNSQSITKLLQDFSVSLTQSSNQELRGTSLLAGYILTLLQTLPGKADDVRMRLFLEDIPTASSPMPILKFLWQIMHQTSIFSNLKTERENSVVVLRRYLNSPSFLAVSIEDQEWKIVLLFLELYIFVLRLSDDEDFFSGIHPHVLESNSSTIRIRACSFSLEQVEAVTTFLKNTAFTLHYKVQEITRHPENVDTSSQSRLDSYWNLEEKAQGHSSVSIERPSGPLFTTPAKLDLDNLRSIVTTALKMLYERDSRKHFLPTDHWLMTGKLENEDFINAVILEEKQNQEQEAESDEEEDQEDFLATSHVEETRFHLTFASHRLSRNARIERLRATQRRALKERRLAEMGPKLEILKHIPFVVPFEVRVKIFRQFIELDRFHRDENDNFSLHPFARHHGKIRRGHVFEDAFKEFYPLGAGLIDPIQITFVDQFGAPEAGIDGGGVTKEFLISITSEAFGNQDGQEMFTSNEKSLLFPNPIKVDVLRQSLQRRGVSEKDDSWRASMADLLKRYEFLGRIIGKCMYEGILIDLAFSGFFLLKWPSPGPKEENSYKGSINDLQDMDEELYKGLLNLKNYPRDVSELGIDFTITDQISAPGKRTKTVSKNLIPNGDKVPVTNDNRLLYISYAARHRLVVQPALQTTAFLRGLRDIIRPSWLSMFNQSELQRLVGGDSTEIDVEDLRRNTEYSGIYAIGDDRQEHPTIKIFWKVMTSFTDKQRRDVLKYVSSTPRAPLLGFSQLKPKFSIRDAGSDEERLPSTSTCVNLLKLPVYRRESILREKLLYAVTSGAGFDLS